MSETTGRTTIPQRDANSYEMRAIEYLAGLNAQVERTKETLRERIRTIPNGWRDTCMIASRLNTLVDAIYDTMTPRQKRHMEVMAKEVEVYVRQRPVVHTRDSHLIPLKMDDVKWLVNLVMTDECAMCVKDERGQKGCELRKRLLCVAPPTEIAANGRCPFLHVVTHCEHGDYLRKEHYD